MHICILNLNIMYGFIESTMTGDELIYPEKQVNLSDYKIKDLLPIIDQGSDGICCSCVASEMQHINNLYNHTGEIPIDYVYNKRKDKSLDGMTPKEALEILQTDGFINLYGRITSILSLKNSLIVNGPALIALPVYSNNSDFWNGDRFMGGHAVSVVGYNEDGFLIKNSWGEDWGDFGYSILPYWQSNKIIESWCIIA